MSILQQRNGLQEQGWIFLVFFVFDIMTAKESTFYFACYKKRVKVSWRCLFVWEFERK